VPPYLRGEVSVAAGVRLRRNQHQSRASWNRLRTRRGASKSGKDREDKSVRGQNPETDGSQNCETEKKRHNKRNHFRLTLENRSFNI
jgi:hypothetical protein